MAIERIDPELCNGCGICVQICPMDVIRLDEKRKKAIIKYPEDCQTCFSCELACVVKAVDVHPFRKPRPMAW